MRSAIVWCGVVAGSMGWTYRSAGIGWLQVGITIMRLFRPERLSSEKRRKFLASDIYIYGNVGSARKANPGQSL